MLPVAISLSTGEAMLIIVLATVPVALVTFVLGAGNALNQIGRGPFAVEFDSDLPPRVTDEEPAEPSQAREDEIRQMLEAKAYRQHARGQTPLDVDTELGRLLEDRPPPNLSSDRQLVKEVRQLVMARNERRVRQGKEPLEVDAEVERQLRELESLGQ